MKRHGTKQVSKEELRNRIAVKEIKDWFVKNEFKVTLFNLETKYPKFIPEKIKNRIIIEFNLTPNETI